MAQRGNVRLKVIVEDGVKDVWRGDSFGLPLSSSNVYVRAMFPKLNSSSKEPLNSIRPLSSQCSARDIFSLDCWQEPFSLVLGLYLTQPSLIKSVTHFR